MGIYNSSTTRVQPVFDRLVDSDPTGRSWLMRLLQLGSRAGEIALPQDVGELESGHPRWWGQHERRLRPPARLLEWLVQNVSEDAVIRSKDTGPKREKRLLLAQHDPLTISDALSGIRQARERRAWYLLEGESCPDAFIQTANTLLVIEGKRTESSCTSKTTWMACRSQLIRHMDAAFEMHDGRRVLGLLIVEGPDSSDGLTPSPFWLREANDQISRETLTASLPHRTPEERHALASGMLGATTWQRVCQEFEIPWPPAP